MRSRVSDRGLVEVVLCWLTLPGGSPGSLPAQELARRLRTGRIRVFPRLQAQSVVLDLRSVLREEDSRVTLALRLVDEAATAPQRCV